MLYLLWGLLSLGIFIYFITVCFNAAKFIREKKGMLATVVFAFGLLSFVGYSGKRNKESNSLRSKSWQFFDEKNLKNGTRRMIDVGLEQNMVTTYHLDISYGLDSVNNAVPLSASLSTTGLVAGTVVQASSITISDTAEKNKFEYIVDGTVEWNLLGANVYTQLKSYHGFAYAK